MNLACILRRERGPFRGVLNVPRLNFKRRNWISTSNFGRFTCRCRNLVWKPLISISINSFVVTVLVYINTCVTYKMGTRRVWRYNGNGARRLWLLFMVTEVRQGVLNMTNPGFRHWSRLLWCLMTGFANGAFAGRAHSDISFESSLCRFLFFVSGPLGESCDRFLFFSLNFPEGFYI